MPDFSRVSRQCRTSFLSLTENGKFKTVINTVPEVCMNLYKHWPCVCNAVEIQYIGDNMVGFWEIFYCISLLSLAFDIFSRCC